MSDDESEEALDTFQFTLDVTFSDYVLPIKNSGQSFYLAAGDINPDSSYPAESSAQAVAGTPLVVPITVCDTYGNPLLYGDYSSRFSVSLPSLSSNQLAKFNSSITASAADHLYSWTVAFYTTGEFSLAVALDGEHIKNSPFLFTVVAHDMSAQDSSAEGEGLHDIATSGANTITIAPKDEFGNSVTYYSGLASFTTRFNVTVSCRGVLLPEENIETSYDDDSDTFVITYYIDGAFGDDTDVRKLIVSIDFEGSPVSGVCNGGETISPFSVYKMHVTETMDMSLAARISIGIIAGLCLLGYTLCATLIQRWRKYDHIKFGQRRFLHVLLFGCFVLGLALSIPAISRP